MVEAFKSREKRCKRILVACEFSGVVRDAFIARGHDAVSCDLLPSDRPGPHIQDDVLNHLNDGWGGMIAFPPCTHLCSSGARWWKDKEFEQERAIRFVRALWNAPIPKISIENPVGILSRAIRPPSQIIQPWQFGHAEIKTTCLWLKGLDPLRPTKIVWDERNQSCWKQPPSKDRWKLRSATYTGIAAAMADQWGSGGYHPQESLDFDGVTW